MSRWLCLVLLSAVACGGANTETPAKHPPPPRTTAATDAQRVRALDAYRFADVPAGTFGPYVADTPSGGIAAWAAAGPSKARTWYALPFDADGKPLNKPGTLGSAPADVGLAIIEPATRAEDIKPSYVLLSTRRDAGRTIIEARRLGSKAELLSPPETLAEVTAEVIWLDLVPTDDRPLALFGTKQGEAADLYALPVPGPTPDPTQPKPIALGVRAWQAAPFGPSGAVGFVAPGGPHDSGGRVEVALLDVSGNSTSRVKVSDSPSAESDLDMVAAGSGLLLAWSDRREGESRVFMAAVDRAGKVSRPPAAAVGAIGEQALVRLVPPHDPVGSAYLAWENLLERPAHGRTIELAPVSADGTVASPRVELEHAAVDSMPELTASARGLAALVLAPACRKGDACDGAPMLPTFVELDKNLELLVSEPVKMTPLAGEAPDLAWGLGCVHKNCRVLAAQASDPAPVYSVSLAAVSLDWQPAVARATPSTPPRAVALRALASLDPLADVAAISLGSTTLASWVTYFDPSAPEEKLKKPAADGRLDPPRALLQVRALPENAETFPPANTISIRARSLGGVALAKAAAAPAEALLAWTALDNKLPQVFVTVLDDKAKKLRQRMLTRAPGEKTDVAAAGVGDGWVVAWVDERAGDPEIYAAKLGRQLMGTSPEKRITNAKGSAADVTLLTLGQDAVMAWSDARDAERAGWADIYVATLRGSDASPTGPEQLVAKTPLHSHSPALAAFDKGALLAFIDSSPSDAGGNGEGQVELAQLDEKGHPKAPPITVKPPQGTPTALSVDCAAERCHIVMAVSIGDQSALETFDWTPSLITRPKRLAALTGPALSIGPSLLGREVIFADRSGSEGRVRRMLVEWR